MAGVSYAPPLSAALVYSCFQEKVVSESLSVESLQLFISLVSRLCVFSWLRFCESVVILLFTFQYFDMLVGRQEGSPACKNSLTIPVPKFSMYETF